MVTYSEMGDRDLAVATPKSADRKCSKVVQQKLQGQLQSDRFFSQHETRQTLPNLMNSCDDDTMVNGISTLIDN